MIHPMLSTLLGVIFLDQVTKYLAGQSGLVQLNPGISFGIGSSDSQWLLGLITACLLLGIWYWGHRLWDKYPVIGGFLFGGGTSNLLDRIALGGVRDWLPVPGFNLSNNIADWSISLSLAAILLLEFQNSRQHAKEKEANGH